MLYEVRAGGSRCVAGRELGEEQDDSEEGLYAHLDDDTRIARLESDRVFGAEDEPSHIAPENELGGDQVDG